jgi:HK97 family phage major capsid protein
VKYIDIVRKTIAELAEKRAAAVAEMEAAVAGAEAEQRSALNEDEAARYDAAKAKIAEIDAEVAPLQAREAELAEIEKRALAATLAPVHNPTVPSDPFDLSQLRFGAGRAELHSQVRAALDAVDTLEAREKEAVDRLLRRSDNRNGALARRILITGRPAYRSAFAKVMEGNPYALDDAERQALSDMRAASLTDAAGGYAVPFTLDPTIIDTRSGVANPMRQIATVRTTVTDQWAGVSSAGVSASWDGEAAEVSDDAPTLAQPNIPVHKAQAFVPFSIEVGMDWAAIESDVREMFANAKDDLEASAFFVGTGTLQPTGIVTALDGTSSEVAPTTPETFAVADLYKVEEALGPKYRARASWTANKAIYNDIRQFGTSDSHALWERLGAGQPAQLLGYNAYEASAMDSGFDAAATADNFLLILGDFSQYYVVDRIGLVVDLIPHLFHTGNNRPSGQRGLYAFWRTGGDSVNDNAFRVLNIATTA